MGDLTESIGDALAAWVRAVLHRRAATLVLFAFAALASAFYAARHLGVNTDSANMISASLPWRQAFIEYREAFPVRDRNLIVVVDAPTPQAAEAFARELAAEMRALPELYHAVFLAGDGEFFERNGLLYLSTPELERLSDRLAQAQPLLGLLGERLDGVAVLKVATRALGEADRANAAAALEPFYKELAATLAGASDGHAAPLSWAELIGRSDTSTRRLIVLQPALDYGSLRPGAAAIDGIRQIAARLNAAAEPPVTVRLTGTVAMEYEELASVSRGAGIGAVATFAMVALVLYAALRSFRLLAICLVTLVAGLALTAAFAALAVGRLNLISIAFVVLNVGLGSDYVIHVCLRQKELMAAGVPVADALVETMRGVGASLVLCAITTAAGFYAFIPTDFEGVSELGLIAGTGVFFGLAASVTLLPALVSLLVKDDPAAAARTWLTPRMFSVSSRRPRAVLAAAGATVAVTFAALPWLSFDSDPINLRDPRSESVTTLLELAEDGDAPLYDLVALAPDASTAARWASELERLPTVRRVVTPDALVPRDQAEKIAMLEDVRLFLGTDFAALEAVPADGGALERALVELGTAAADVPAAHELGRAAEKLVARLETLGAAARAARLAALDRDLTSGLPRELGRLEAALDPAAFGREALPAALIERWVADGRELLEIAPAEDLGEAGAARRFVDSVRGVVEGATGLPVVYQEASATVVGAFRTALAAALATVAVIIWLFLRRPRDVLLVIVPILLATGATAGVTVLLGMPFNYANVIALPLLVGLGVDNGIHVVHRMRGDRSAATLFETSTLRAVLASGLTTIASFGNLAFSAHVGTASMGKLLAFGLVISMAATLIVLPAWLTLFERRSAAVSDSR